MNENFPVPPGLESVELEWLNWYRLNFRQRWQETGKLWKFYQEAGGSLDPEPDRQSPFRAAFLPCAVSAHGRSGLRILRRGRI